MRNICAGMAKSRKNFEDAPDTGICSKNMSRICNLIEVYIFRLIFVGLLLVFLGMPIAIIV